MKSNPSNQIPLRIIQRIAAEVLASAILDVFPGALLVSGKETDLGFYYDFQFSQPLTQETLFLVEERMRAIIKEDLQVETLDMMRQNAMEMFRHQSQSFKVTELELSRDNIVQIWKMGKFYDVCLPPENFTSSVPQAFKLLKVERKTIPVSTIKNAKKLHQSIQVIRVTGTAWSSKTELKEFLKKREVLKKQNHQLIGVDSAFFAFDDEIFPQMPIWLPKGEFLREALLNDLKSRDVTLGFKRVKTPNLVAPAFLKKMRLLGEETESNFVEVEGEEYVFSSAKTVLHAKLFSNFKQVEASLPQRFAEIHDCFESEIEPDGLFETRNFTADTATIFCTENQVEQELAANLQLIDQVITVLGLKFEYMLNTNNVKAHLAKRIQHLENALNTVGFQFVIDKENDNIYATHGKGLNHHGLTRGPTIEVVVIDAFGRRWLIASLGIDLATSGILGLNYLNSEGHKEPPMIICRSVFNSLERFIALLLEQTAGNLPLWLNESNGDIQKK